MMSVNFNSIVFLAQLCVLCLGNNSPSGSNTWNGKGYEYQAQIQGWLKLNRDPVDWLAARTFCHLEGAQLVSPWTNQFTAAVNTLQLSANQTNDSEMPLYSGVHITKTSFVEGLYSYIGDEPTVLVEPWYARQDRCGVFYANGTTGEVNCKRRLPYVCYAPAAALMLMQVPEPASTLAPEPICGNKSLGYELSQQTGRCYKFHVQVANWTTANSTCVTEGARLAVPNSDEEMRFLTSIHAKYPDTEISGTPYPNWISVGVFWKSGAWETVDGQALADAGYAKWTRGWPSNMKNYPYVCMDRGGEYSNTYSVLYPYICEKMPRH